MNELDQIQRCVPPGAWAVGVSGGADSVALLLLLRGRSDLSLHIAHLDHETRSGQSTADAQWVADLARRFSLPCTIGLRSQIESTWETIPANLPARFRAARLEFFRRVVLANHLDGVLLAHHADDQAETIFQRLLRGAGPAALVGMAALTNIGGLPILRPLLTVRRSQLRQLLLDARQDWREDSSNSSPWYLRNRLRLILAQSADLHDRLIRLAQASAELTRWCADAAPALEERFACPALASLPASLARQSAKRWLDDRGLPPGEIDRAAGERLIRMAADAAAPPRGQFAGGIMICRRRGMIFREPSDV